MCSGCSYLEDGEPWDVFGEVLLCLQTATLAISEMQLWADQKDGTSCRKGSACLRCPKDERETGRGFPSWNWPGMRQRLGAAVRWGRDVCVSLAEGQGQRW